MIYIKHVSSKWLPFDFFNEFESFSLCVGLEFLIYQITNKVNICSWNVNTIFNNSDTMNIEILQNTR